MNRPNGSLAAAALLAICLPLLNGCAEHYWAETTVHSDGSIERAIYQPRSSLPDEFDESKWRTVMRVHELAKSQMWPDAFSDLEPSSSQEVNYIAARGSFSKASEIPAHFIAKPFSDSHSRVESSTPTPPSTSTSTRSYGELVRAHNRCDYGLFIEHVWSETLTDVIDMNDLLKARRELAALVLEDGERLAKIAYDDVDASRLFAWGRGEGLRWFEELVDAFVDTAFEPDRNSARERRIVEICAGHGLDLDDLGDEPSGLTTDDRIRGFVRSKLTDLLRDSHGERLSETRLTEIIDELFDRVEEPSQAPAPLECVVSGLSRNEAGSLGYGEPTDGQKSRLKQIADQFIIDRYGSEEAFEKRIEALVVRVVGVHQARLGARRFRYVVNMPGFIVESSGTLLDDHRAQFQFEAADAFPYGYRMTCRSLEPRMDIQKATLGEARVADRASLVRLHAMFEQDGELAESLRAAARDRSSAVIREHLRDEACPLSARQRRELVVLLGL